MTLLDAFRNTINTIRGITTSSIGSTASPSYIQEPIVYEYMDPEYVGECLVELESDFKYELVTDPDNGLRTINIYHDAIDGRAQQLNTLLTQAELRAKMLRELDDAIEKIRIEYPDFSYHIHYDMNIFSMNYGARQHGTQVYRILSSERGLPGLEGMQGVAGERYHMGNGEW